MERQSSHLRTSSWTLVCIFNHSLAVGHPFLDGGASGARFTSAPPTTTPSADAIYKERVHQDMFKNAAKVRQLPALLRTKQAGTSKRPLEEETGDRSTQYKAKKAKTTQVIVTQRAPAHSRPQKPNAPPVQGHFPEVSTPFFLSPASNSNRTPWS